MESVDDLSKLVNELLISSRIERGNFEVLKEPVNINELIDNVIEFYSNKYYKKGLSLKFNKNKIQTNIINIDKEKIRQVLINLIENAYNYTNVGGVAIDLMGNDGKVKIIVSDTGIGIPKVGQDKLFERFVRLDNAKSMRPDGTGIGLFTAKVIVEKHGGRIWFESVLGKGTKFFIELPI